MYLPYAGIGSRKTPMEILSLMARIGKVLSQEGFTLRSGAAQGADSAFESGHEKGLHIKGEKPGLRKEIYLPWYGYNNHKHGIVGFANKEAEEKAFSISEKYHPAWDRCTTQVRTLHARNVAQVLGYDLESPSKFIVCLTPNASGSGGTGQALRIARGYDIPVYDLGRDTTNTLDALAMFCEMLARPEIAEQ